MKERVARAPPEDLLVLLFKSWERVLGTGRMSSPPGDMFGDETLWKDKR